MALPLPRLFSSPPPSQLAFRASQGELVSVLASVLLTACSHQPAAAPKPGENHPGARRSSSRKGSYGGPKHAPSFAYGFDYQVEVLEGGSRLRVQGLVAPGMGPGLTIERGAASAVKDLRSRPLGGGKFQPVKRQAGRWLAPDCNREGCELRYEFHLAKTCRSLRDIDRCEKHHGAYFAPPSTWLIYPAEPHYEKQVHLRVNAPSHVGFASGLFFDPKSKTDTLSKQRSFTFSTWDAGSTPYTAIGDLAVTEINYPESKLELAIPRRAFSAKKRRKLHRYVAKMSNVVRRYFGRFPVPHGAILVVPVRGNRLVFGKALGNGGASILLFVGQDFPQRALDTDWILVHEMVHWSFPNLPATQAWMEEGLATYLEPIMRVKAGILPESELWSGLHWGLPKGTPVEGDRGLDFNHSWGNTYWGGAGFAMATDLAIRHKSKGTQSLRDALVHILKAGGNISQSWKVKQAMQLGDKALEHPILWKNYQAFGLHRTDSNPKAMWRKLGIDFGGSKPPYRSQAPWAGMRGQIVRPMGKASGVWFTREEQSR